MLARRIIACLDVRGARVVKGVSFQGLRDVGDPVELAARYAREGADEIVFLDISASTEEREMMLDVATRTAECLFIPLTLGGGIRSADDAARALRAGADKVSVNSAAVARPSLLGEMADRFGSQAVVIAIDAKAGNGGWTVMTHGGSRDAGMDAGAWAEEAVSLGAGEILLTSVDRDGRRDGYDLALTRAIAGRVSVPVIASGGAGNAAHVADVLERTPADAALLAGILHDGLCTVDEIKRAVEARGISIRAAA